MSQSVFRFVAGGVSLAIGSAFAGAPATEVAETVVTATRTPVQAASLTRDVSVITRDDIARAGPTSLPELLSREAGIEFASNGGDGRQSSLFIRGTNSNQSVVLIDGVRTGTVGRVSMDMLAVDLTPVPAAGFGSVQPLVAAVERIQGGFGVKRVPDRLAGRGIRHAATSGDDGHACIKNRDRRSVLDTWQTPGRSGMTLGIVLFLVNLKVIYGTGAWIGGGFHCCPVK